MTSEDEPVQGQPETDPGQTGIRPGRGRRGRRIWLVAVAGLAVLAGGAVYVDLSSPTNAVTDPLVDRTYTPAPPFSLPELLRPSRTMSLAEFRGKPLVVNFWASWCYPCQTEMPLLETSYRSERGRVQFLGVDTNDRREAAVKFLARTRVTYPCVVLANPHSPLTAAYGLVGLPITVFISPTGTVVGRHIGQINAATLQVALRLAFGRDR